MKKRVSAPAVMIIVIQILLGIAFVLTSFYMDENIYLETEGFFMHFMHVPGGTFVIMSLHYLLYGKYDRKGNFILTGMSSAFMICNTGECILLLNEMFPNGWIRNVLWFILADVITAALITFFHLAFVFFMSKKNAA